MWKIGVYPHVHVLYVCLLNALIVDKCSTLDLLPECCISTRATMN